MIFRKLLKNRNSKNSYSDKPIRNNIIITNDETAKWFLTQANKLITTDMKTQKEEQLKPFESLIYNVGR